jgi:hypothetical protein
VQDGARYVIVRQIPRGLLGILYEESRVMAPRLILAFLLAGGLCYWLARHLTAPGRRLQNAVRKFADGDLTVHPFEHSTFQILSYLLTSGDSAITLIESCTTTPGILRSGAWPVHKCRYDSRLS